MAKGLENWKGIRLSEKEEQILEAYVTVALREGVEQVTLQKTAKQAKIPYATVHYYFGTPEKSQGRTMMESALVYVGIASERYIETAMHEVMHKENKSSIEAYVEAKFKWNDEFPKYASLWCYFIYQASRDPEYKKLNEQFTEDGRNRLRTFLLLEIGKGRYKSLRNIDVLADEIHQLIMGAMVLSMSAASSPKLLKERKQTTHRLIEQLIAQRQ